MLVEGSVYSLCEPKRALISGRAASIFRIWIRRLAHGGSDVIRICGERRPSHQQTTKAERRCRRVCGQCSGTSAGSPSRSLRGA